ncbi:MAG: alpha-galactosidase [Saprospiraceae bacterium]|nr:alpha-galactosidase [Saprospiraceae bacterium]
MCKPKQVLLSLFLCLSCLSVSTQSSLKPEPNWPSSTEKDWLLDASPFQAGLFAGGSPSTISLSNGLIRRSFLLQPNLTTIALDKLVNGENLLRGVKPEASVTLNGKTYKVGGLQGQQNYAFLRPQDLAKLSLDEEALSFIRYEVGPTAAPFSWKRLRHHAKDAAWPPKGTHLQLDFAGPNCMVSVHYELYDGIPVYSKWLSVKNTGKDSLLVDRFTSEILAAVEYGSATETRKYGIAPPNIHVETDYAFASFNAEDANHHVVHWEPDPDYDSQVNYLKLTPCLLKVSPEIGPAQQIAPGGTFTSFRTFVLPHDSYDRERQGLALRKMYRTLAPWTTENPLMMHARFADWPQVKKAIDQAAAVGFEMVILTFGSGFNIEDDSEEYIREMKRYADYARSKGVEIGGYSLLASRSISAEHDVVMPEGQKPTFGNSPCIGSEWGEEYFQKLYQFYEQTGFTLLEHDGSYPGDVCTANTHPGHRAYADSRWNQYQVISGFYKWCRSQGIYLNVPDYYYLTGSNKCGMGYREVNWSLPRAQQVLHTRQNIYDGAWTKTPSMGWMFVPLTEYHGGGEAATIEPLNEHLDHYEKMIISNLGGGVQACYRGPRLFDTTETKRMVSEAVSWFKQHREVLEGDIIHLRRADGRDIDYWLNVNPQGEEKGLLMVFNPLDQAVRKEIELPLYYTGLRETAKIRHEDQKPAMYTLDRSYRVKLPINVPAQGYTWFVIE